MPDIANAINTLENSLRDLVEILLRRAHGETWEEHLGVSDERLAAWRSRRKEEPRRRPGGQTDERLLYYSEFYDLCSMIKKHWDRGFKDCFKDRKRFDVYMDRLSAFRNPDAHSRVLRPFEEHLVLGMTGEMRQEMTVFLSAGGGGPRREHFARIEEIRDSYGLRTRGQASGGPLLQRSSLVLHPGDGVTFIGRAWDPEGAAVTWEITKFIQGTRLASLESHEIEWTWEVGEADIGEMVGIQFLIKSPRGYSRNMGGGDDVASVSYDVLPA